MTYGGEWVDTYSMPIRMNANNDEKQKPREGHAYIYAVEHQKTGLLCVGFTSQCLAARWLNYLHDAASYSHGRNAGRAKPRAAALHRLINKCGPDAFIVSELEECALAIRRERELDHMRQFQSWNPAKGFNAPSNESYYARKLCFLLHPDEEALFAALLKEREDILWEGGNMNEFAEKYEKHHSRWVSIGTALLPAISSLATPIVTLSHQSVIAR